MKLVAPLLVFALSLSAVAQAKSLNCFMNGKIQIDGSPLNISISLDYGWFGTGKAKGGTYSYEVESGAQGNGNLTCDGTNEFGQQYCTPSGGDAILDKVIIKPGWGPVIQVHGQDPIGLMTCN